MHKALPLLSLLLICCLTVTSVHAGPAPWYWWTSKVDGARICRQTSPGDGWRQGHTAYRDARCRVPAVSTQ